MWVFVNHTKRHIVSADLCDIGRQLKYVIVNCKWSLVDDIDMEDLDRRDGKYQDYTWDL